MHRCLVCMALNRLNRFSYTVKDTSDAPEERLYKRWRCWDQSPG